MKNVATDFKEAFLLIRFFDSYITLVYQDKCLGLMSLGPWILFLSSSIIKYSSVFLNSVLEG